MNGQLGQCIFCGSGGPFSDEHAVPAGLGAGNNPNFILRSLVCATCNSRFSTELEAPVLRKGEIAVQRTFLQGEGRQRGKKATRSPQLDVVASTTLHHSSKHLVEARAKFGRTFEVLPQLYVDGLTGEMRGGDLAKMRTFLEGLESIFAVENLVMVRQRIPMTSASPKSYDIVLLKWRATGYEIYVLTDGPSVPTHQVWIKDHPKPEQTHNIKASVPRVYQDERGRIIAVVKNLNEAVSVMTTLRASIASMRAPLEAAPTIFEPSHLTLQVESPTAPDRDVARLLAKIGLNLACIAYGPIALRSDVFDYVKQGILSGDPELELCSFLEEFPVPGALIDAIAERFHSFVLMPVQDLGGDLLVLACRLYGLPTKVVVLSDYADATVGFEPVVFLVDYTRQLMGQFTPAQLAGLGSNDPFAFK